MIFRLLKTYSIGIMVLLVIVAAVKSGHGDNYDLPSALKNDPMLRHIQSQLQRRDYDNAFELIEKTLSETKDSQQNQLKSVWLYRMQAGLYERRYHYHLAISALAKAQALMPDQANINKINAWQQRISQMQAERNKYDKYTSGYNAGLTRELKNKINIAYIYINDTANAEWTGKRRLLNQSYVNRITAWYQREAQKYGQLQPNFNVRYFVINSPKGIERNLLRKRSTLPYLTDLLIKQSHYSSLNEFIENIRGKDSDDEVALVFHSNYSGRSHAYRCVKSMYRCGMEYAMLTEDISRKRHGWLIEQTQAHEILHLFGADDLYNISLAKDYAVTDIMNYYSSDLFYASIDPLTAWAIGWHHQPITPFAVEQ